MELELSHGNQEISTMVSISMTSELDMEKCVGPTDLFIKVNGKKVSNMALELCLFRMEEFKMVSLKTMYFKKVPQSWMMIAHRTNQVHRKDLNLNNKTKWIYSRRGKISTRFKGFRKISEYIHVSAGKIAINSDLHID